MASRIIEQYFLPTVLLTKSEGKWVGSARSIPGFNIYEALNECNEFYHSFGGHFAAAGLTIPEENLLPFIKKFDQVCSKGLNDELLTPSIEYDDIIEIDQINSTLLNSLYRLGPFGPENMIPVFKSTRVKAKWPKVLKEKHLSFQVETPDNSIKAIAFGLGSKANLIENGREFDMCFTIEKNYWKDNLYIQLNIKDIKPSE